MVQNLPILHFNDVYRVTPQKVPGTKETIDVTQFTAQLHGIRDKWDKRPDGQREGLVLFSGDLFSPSVESSVTRGSHMVPVINFIGPDVSLTGNHDFDFGFPHLTTLVRDTTFPWVLSNIIDTTTSKAPAHLLEYVVLERCGIRIGIIGLVEKEWIATISSWPPHFEWKDMVEVGIDLSKRLRDPSGEHRCDLVIALTHCRLPNDIQLAKRLKAFSPSWQKNSDIKNEHGVDILLGGHDHTYYASRGTTWEGYDVGTGTPGADDDVGDVLIVKSGTDFHELTELIIEFEESPGDSVRKITISGVKGKRLEITPDLPPSVPLQELLSKLLTDVSETMKAPICQASAAIDVRSELIRLQESASGNLIADILRHAYDDALCVQGSAGSDGVFICAGTLRGDTVYGPGVITLGDILEVLPFDDPVVVLELDGRSIWDALESSLSTWPALEGRFPVLSGFRVTWDSRRPPGSRVISVTQVRSNEEHSDDEGSHDDLTHSAIEEEDVKREVGGKKYVVVTRDYMAGGHDGFVALKDHKYLIDEETGQPMSTIVRKYLLGATYLRQMSASPETPTEKKLHHGDTPETIARARKRRLKSLLREYTHQVGAYVLSHPKPTPGTVIRFRSSLHYLIPLLLSTREHMSSADCFDGARARAGFKEGENVKQPEHKEKELVVVHPFVDGRLHDIGRSPSH